MNPIGALIILLGVISIIVGMKGTQQKVKAAISNARPSVVAQSSVAHAGVAPQTRGGLTPV